MEITVETSVAKWRMFYEHNHITAGQAYCAGCASFNKYDDELTKVVMPREQFDKLRAVWVASIGASKFDASVTIV